MPYAQIIYLFIVVLGLGIALAKDGQPKTDKYSFWGTVVATLISLGLLYWGGFFNIFFSR